jgi:anion transporter
MKFAKKLKENSIIGWEEYYVSYIRLKRAIKKIQQEKIAKKRREKQLLAVELTSNTNSTPANSPPNNSSNIPANNNNKSNNSNTNNNPSNLGIHDDDLDAEVAADSSESSSDEEDQGSSHASKKSQATATTLVLPDKADTYNKTRERNNPSSSPNSNSTMSPVTPSLSSQASPQVSAEKKQQQRVEWANLLKSGDAKQQFWHLFEQDLSKVNGFYVDKYEEIRAQYEDFSSKDNTGLSYRFSALTPRSKQTNNLPASEETSLSSHNNQIQYGSIVEQPEAKSLHNTSYSANPSNSNNISVDLDEQPVRVISTSQAGQLEARSRSVLLLYRTCLQLQSFSALNYSAFDKIMKKYDKYSGEKQRKAIILGKIEPAEFIHGKSKLSALIQRCEELYMKLSVARNQEAKTTHALLRAVERDVENNEGGSFIHENNIINLSQNSDFSGFLDQLRWNFGLTSRFWVLVAVILFTIILNLPLFPGHPRAQRCLALLTFTTILWITEAVAYFVTALIIPFFVVVLQILADENNNVLNAEQASKAAFGAFYTDATILIASGFTIAVAFSKSTYELQLANFIQRWTGQQPRLFLLSYMFLGCFLSLFISNIAAPVLLTSLLLPHLRDFPRNNAYARSLLLGLAFSCNIGGLIAPISSPENLIILVYLEAKYPQHAVNFVDWLFIAVPFAIVCILLIYAYLWLVILRPNREDIPIMIPSIVYDKSEKLKPRDNIVILATTVISILLMCSLENESVRHIFGSMSTIGFIPILLFFGSGILTKNDLKMFSWQLILLIGGGSVLGLAINSSKLLNIMTDSLLPYFQSQSVFINALVVIVLVWLCTSVVSHTVTAIILTPVIIAVGNSVHHSHLITIVAAFAIHCTCSFPMTSFPNMNSLLVDDDFGRPYLHTTDFVKHGTIISALLMLLLSTYGYSLIRLTFDKPLNLL